MSWFVFVTLHVGGWGGGEGVLVHYELGAMLVQCMRGMGAGAAAGAGVPLLDYQPH